MLCCFSIINSGLPVCIIIEIIIAPKQAKKIPGPAFLTINCISPIEACNSLLLFSLVSLEFAADNNNNMHLLFSVNFFDQDFSNIQTIILNFGAYYNGIVWINESEATHVVR